MSLFAKTARKALSAPKGAITPPRSITPLDENFMDLVVLER